MRDVKSDGSAGFFDGVPRRDYLWLPLLSVLTVFVIFCVTEVATRFVWNSQEEDACVIGVAADGFKFKPNCDSRIKVPEGPWTNYHYNECGYRSNSSCGPVAPGSLRIAILGASVSAGLNVPYEQTYFARAAAELSRRCGRPVDIQNLGKPKSSPLFAYRRLDEALRLKPDLVLFLMTPFDLEQQIDPNEMAERDNATLKAAQAVTEPLSLMRRLQVLVVNSRTVTVAEHFLLENRDTYLNLYLRYGDKADVLRKPLTPAWQQRFADMETLIGGMAAKLQPTGVPLAVMAVPSRAEAALLSMPHPPAGTAAAAFGETLGSIAAAHGAINVDMMQPFARTPDSQDLFLVVDGHVSADGQALMANTLTQKLLDGTVPAFTGCTAASEPIGAAR